MHIKEVENMFWGVTLDGGKRYTQTVERAFHLSMAALEPAPVSEKKKSDSLISVMIQHEKAEFMLCTLEQGRMFQQPLDLNFTEGEEVTFFLSNNNGVVHLTGYLIEEEQIDPDDLSPEDFMDVPTSEEEDSDSEVPALIGGHSDDDSDGQKVPAYGKKRKKEKGGKLEKKKKMKLIESDSDEDDDDDFDEDEDDLADFIDDEADEDSEEDEDEDEEEILTPKKKQKKSPEKKQTSQKKEKTKQQVQTPTQKEADVQEPGEGKKKKKKKKKKKNKEGDEQTNTTETPKQQQQPKKQVLAGGVVCEDLKVGHGPAATPGKMVHVYYAGKLQKTGQQFDSCKQGKPFRFRLGKGEVIKGWDTGVSGMKVGGKRKLIVPSQQGYGNSRQGPIPAGSTLEFEVELKAVS